jgi:hypothetical protein
MGANLSHSFRVIGRFRLKTTAGLESALSQCLRSPRSRQRLVAMVEGSRAKTLINCGAAQDRLRCAPESCRRPPMTRRAVSCRIAAFQQRRPASPRGDQSPSHRCLAVLAMDLGISSVRRLRHPGPRVTRRQFHTKPPRNWGTPAVTNQSRAVPGTNRGRRPRTLIAGDSPPIAGIVVTLPAVRRVSDAQAGSSPAPSTCPWPRPRSA